MVRNIGKLDTGLMRPQVRISGHFGEFMQGRIGPKGPVALISVPCPVLGVDGWHCPGPGLSIHGGAQRLLTPLRALKMLRKLGTGLRGRVILHAAMPAGGGAGASTASLLALARLSGADLAPRELARIVVETEGASDPLMFSGPERILWASRQGRVIDRLPPVPPMDILGGFFGPPRRTDPADNHFPDISDLIEPWRAATGLMSLAALASQSARRTLAFRGMGDDPTEALARDLGALGFIIAHTGSARGLIFGPGTVPLTGRELLRRNGFGGVVQFRVGGQEW